jgi:hypothetical protein
MISLYFNRKPGNLQDYQSVGTNYIMLPAMLCTGKCMWLMFLFNFDKSDLFLQLNFLLRLCISKQWLAY